jgi:hypothetical protein
MLSPAVKFRINKITSKTIMYILFIHVQGHFTSKEKDLSSRTNSGKECMIVPTTEQYDPEYHYYVTSTGHGSFNAPTSKLLLVMHYTRS